MLRRRIDTTIAATGLHPSAATPPIDPGALGDLWLCACAARLIALLIACLVPHAPWRLARRRSPWPRRIIAASLA